MTFISQQITSDNGLSLAAPAPGPQMSVPLILKGQTISGDEQSSGTEDRAVSFEIRSVIGEGGMGMVYEAVQDYPCRTVALKALKGALVEGGLVKRFQREVNILALLRHPGIGQLYTAGTLEDGLGMRVPFLAMELVHGPPIHLYCRKHRLGIRQRLELFLKVADAVQYVHTTGIIHRDLSCRNILVNERGEPKVLDFGLANFVNGRGQELTQATVAGHPFGTLRYISPEQAAGRVRDVDHQTDVYALGVILYKLLAGRHPLDSTGLSAAEVVRRIQEVEPPRLSLRDKKLRGDIETITQKAMCKIKTGRYASVADLAADVRHYLANEPIQARRASFVYRSAKYIRRHRILVSTATMIMLSLSVGMVGAMHEAGRANVEATRANAETVRARFEARQASIALAYAKVAQGDASVASMQYQEARDCYNAASEIFDRAGESSRPAQLATWELDQVCARPIREILPSGNGVEQLAISQNQRWLATSQTGLVEVREIPTNKVVLQFAMKGNVSKLVFSPDGKFIAALAEGRYTVWELAGNKLVASSETVAREKISWISLSNESLATATYRGMLNVRKFNGSTGGIADIGVHKALSCLSFVSDGRLFAVDSDSQVWQRPATGGNFELLGTLPHLLVNKITPRLCAISSAGGFIATVSGEDTLIYALPDLREVGRLPGSIQAGFASESTVFTCSAAGDLYSLWGIDGQLRLVLPCQALNLAAFSGDVAAVADQNRPLLIWSIAPSPGVKQLISPVRPTVGVISHDGRLAVLGGKDGAIRIYDTTSGILKSSLDAGAPLKFLAMDNSVKQLVAVTQQDTVGNIQFWDMETLKKTSEFHELGSVTALAVARSGTIAISCVAPEKTLCVWQKTGGQWTSTRFGTEFLGMRIDLASDEESFALGGNPAGIELWALRPAVSRRTILPRSNGCREALFSQNPPSILARDTQDKALLIWPMGGLESTPVRLDFSKAPDGMAISDGAEAIVSAVDSVYVLDLQRQRVVRRLAVPGNIRILGASGNGQRVLAINSKSQAVLLDFVNSSSLPENSHRVDLYP